MYRTMRPTDRKPTAQADKSAKLLTMPPSMQPTAANRSGGIVVGSSGNLVAGPTDQNAMQPTSAKSTVDGYQRDNDIPTLDSLLWYARNYG